MKYAVSVLLLVILLSCNPDKEIIPIPAMELLLLDLHLAQEKATVLSDGKSNVQQDSLKIYTASVLKHHKVSLPRYRYSLRYYQEDSQLMDSIYNGMVDTVMKMKLDPQNKK